MRIPFRIRFSSRRLFSPSYWKKLSGVLPHPFRFFWILMIKVAPWSSKQPVRLKLRDGKVLLVREFWSLFLFDEIFVEKCYEASELLAKGPFEEIIDVGANIGLFTIRSKQLWPHARVLSLEPHPGNFAHLQEHIKINELSGVTAYSEGVADECGCLELNVSARNISGHSMYKPGSSSVKVPVSTLSDLIHRSGFGKGKILIKVDCEGCEFPLLNGLDQQLAAKFSGIIFEPELQLYSLPDLCRKMQTLGFEVSRFGSLVVLTQQGESQSTTRERIALHR